MTCLPVVLGGLAMTAQAPPSPPAYVVRGRGVEVVQQAFAARLTRFHEAMAAALRVSAPDLLTRLRSAPPPVATGYQRLPRLVSDAPPKAPAKPQVVRYDWAWTETLFARESAALVRAEAELASGLSEPGTPRRSALESLVTEYRRVEDARRGIDADVAYNWFWQGQIAARRASFEATTRLIDAAVAAAESGAPPPSDLLARSAPQRPPSFVRVSTPTPHAHVVTIAMVTDVVDDAFLRRFSDVVETHWAVTSGRESYRVRLDIRQVPPRQLYCPARSDSQTPDDCRPPANGDPIDVDAHAERFPLEVAILTTGAKALHVTRGRVIALAPFDAAARTLAHEVGHLLGFPDAYLRGARDLGVDGFRVLEYVPDMTDIMAAPGFGSVSERHFRQLIAALAQ